jgi:electron-transferring-flavoprotein dehydrogenase
LDAHRGLDQTRNFKQWFKKGNLVGALMTGIEQWLLPKLGIKQPAVDASPHPSTTTPPCARPPGPQISYPKPDGKLTFDRLSSVFVSATPTTKKTSPRTSRSRTPSCRCAQPGEIRRPREPLLPGRGLRVRANDDGSERLQINAQNCVHCKTCDIKDPSQNIVVTPGGPNYAGM